MAFTKIITPVWILSWVLCSAGCRPKAVPDESLQSAAESGSIAHQYELGKWYSGLAGYRNEKEIEEKARSWLLKAAEGGHGDAQYLVAKLGEGSSWFVRAAENGNADAQSALGDFYYYGENGFDVDSKEAARWWLAAAEQGVVKAQLNIAACYSRGEGLRQDDEEAFRWSKEAAKDGAADHSLLIAEEFRRREQPTMYVEWLRRAVKARSEADRWEQGESARMRARMLLGELYVNGELVPRDHKEALRLFEAAAEGGDRDARLRVAEHYRNGDSDIRNLHMAEKWELSAEKSQ